MKLKKLELSWIPGFLFFLSVIYLIFSGLGTAKAIRASNEVMQIFVKELLEKDVLEALKSSIFYAFYEIVVPLIPFLFLLGGGFFSLYLLKERIGYWFLPALVLLFIPIYLSNFSIIIISLAIGIFISTLILWKFFEPKKRRFSTASSLVIDHIHYITIFLAIALFLNSFLKFESYKQIAFEGNVGIVKLVVPDVKKIGEKLIEQEINYINASCEQIKSSINSSYETLPDYMREECKPLLESTITAIDYYKQEAISQAQIRNQTLEEETEEYLRQYFPIIEQMTKGTPLFLAISLYAILRILTFFIASFFGAAYQLSGKKFIREKSS